MKKKQEPGLYHSIEMQADGRVQIRIFGVIGESFFEDGVGAQRFAEDIDALDGNPDLDVSISSPGGSVIEGTAIHSVLRQYSGAVRVQILSEAASIASVIAMAADPGELAIARAGRIMIHNAHGGARGDARLMKKYADILDMVTGQMADVYVERTGLKRADVLAMMDEETWMTGQEAVDQGFADSILDEAGDVDIAARSFDPALFGDIRKYEACVARAESGLDEETDMKDEVKKKDGQTPTQDSAGNTDNVISIREEVEKAIKEAMGDTTQVVKNAVSDAISAVRADQERETRVRAVFAPYQGELGPYKEVLNAVLAKKGDETAAKAALFDAQGEGTEPLGGHMDIRMGKDWAEKQVLGMTTALHDRYKGKTSDPQNNFNGFSMVEMARICAQNVPHISRSSSRLEIVGAALSHGTSNFPQILENIASKALLTGWEEEPTTYQRWTRPGTLTDFKQAKRVGAHTFGNLPEVKEGAEFTYAVRDETGEPIILATYGNVFSLTRQAIINDDLGALTDIPTAQGGAAARTVNATAFAVLTANSGAGVVMSDNDELFHANHNNIGSTAALSVDTVDGLRLLLATQTDLAGTRLNIQPAYLLVPAALDTTARTVINNANDPRSGAVANTINPVNGLAEVISDGILDGTSTTRHYLFASNTRDVVEVAFLDGVREPFMDRDEPFLVDVVRWKVRIDVGASPRDFRGMTMNAGA